MTRKRKRDSSSDLDDTISVAAFLADNPERAVHSGSAAAVTRPSPTPVKEYVNLRCPCCGTRRYSTAYAAAAQPYTADASVQRFVGCGRGVDANGRVPADADGRPLQGRKRGAFHWTRRPPTIAELEQLGRAVALAATRIAQQIDARGARSTAPRSSRDTVTDWLAEHTVRDTGVRTSRDVAWTDYHQFTTSRGSKAVSLATFRRRLAAAGIRGADGRVGGLPLRILSTSDPSIHADDGEDSADPIEAEVSRWLWGPRRPRRTTGGRP